MPATIRDVAKRAGVGLGTVSRVLNESPQVSAATRQRVLEVIEDLNFHPSLIARRLSLGRSLTIAVVASFFTRPATVERLRGVSLTLADTEYDLIVFDVESAERRRTIFQELGRRSDMDGVLVISLPADRADLEHIQAGGIPVVIIDVDDPQLEGFHQVVTDDVRGGRMAVEHLIELGHKRIGFISDPLTDAFHFSASQRRFEGYKQALHEHGLALNPAWHRHGEHGRYEAKRLASEMIALAERPTAIFAASDTQAIGVLEAAREAGLRIPAELSVVGYDDVEIAAYLDLTTIRQMLYESGSSGVTLLLETIQRPGAEPVRSVLPTELVVRGTTAPPGSNHSGRRGRSNSSNGPASAVIKRTR